MYWVTKKEMEHPKVGYWGILDVGSNANFKNSLLSSSPYNFLLQMKGMLIKVVK
jgi:hypothetical protein